MSEEKNNRFEENEELSNESKFVEKDLSNSSEPQTNESQNEYFCHVYSNHEKVEEISKPTQNMYTQDNLNNDLTNEVKKVKSSGKQKGLKAVLGIVAIILVAAIAGGVFGVVAHYTNKLFDDEPHETVGTVDMPDFDPEITIDPTIKIEGDAEGVTTGITEMVKAVMPAMVSINVTATEIVGGGFWGGQYEQEVQGSGSGIIISQTNDTLYIATNFHVVEGAKKISACFIDGKYYEAAVKGSDSDFDLAVISIPLSKIDSDTISKIKVAVIGSSDKLNLGEPAIAIGNALGYGQSVTVGYISALAREVEMENNTMTLIQTDAAINPGNSGGALLNINGEVVGINSAKFASTEVEGMGFAIPISDAVPIINDIINETAIPEKEQAQLGITGSTVESAWVSYYGWPEGVYVSQVTKDSPADKSGIRANDIIVKFDGRTVSSIDSLTEKLKKKRGGETVEIVIMRQDNYGKFEEKKITVTLGFKNAD